MSVTDDSDFLDESWVLQFKKEENDYNDFYMEMPTSIKLYFMYVNNENSIEIVKTEQFLLDDQGKITKEQLISIIKNQQIFYNTNYKLLSLLKFNINIHPLDVVSNTYSLSDDKNYLSVEHYIQDIQFQDTVCILHDLNSLFFIFMERNENNKTSKNQTKKITINTNFRKTNKKRA